MTSCVLACMGIFVQEGVNPQDPNQHHTCTYCSFFLKPEHDYAPFPGNFDSGKKKPLQVIPLPHPRVFQTLPKN